MSVVRKCIASLAITISVGIFAALSPVSIGNAASEKEPTEFELQTVRFPNNIVAHPDVVYAVERGYRPFRLDIYNEAQQSGKKPLILFVHGGAWEGGNKRSLGEFRDFPAILANLAHRGYVVASVEYRFNGEAGFPAPFHDIQSAIRFLRVNAEQYGINPEEIGIWGSSSGGQLAALAAVTCETDALDRVTDQPIETSACVQSAAIWNGVLDLKAMEPAPTPSQNGHPRSRLLNCNPGFCTNYVLEAASPYNYISAKSPPFFLAHSRADDVVPVAQSEEFERKLKQNGVPVTSVYVDDLKHGFRAQTLDETLSFGENLLEKTFEFFDKTLKN